MTPNDQSPLDLWKQASAGLPDMPDSARDSFRETFFKQHVIPWAGRNGYNIQNARDAFFQETERPDKASMPRLELGAFKAMDTLAGPVLGALGARDTQKRFGEAVGLAEKEAERQGAGTAIPELLGSAAGSLPYFLPATRAASAVLGGGAVANMTGFGIAEGVMSAGKAEDGQRMVEGFKGYAEGFATGAAFEALPAARQLLRDPKISKAMENTIRGIATPEEKSLAEASSVLIPEIPEELAKKAVGDATAAQAAGVPKAPSVVVSKGQGKITVTTRDKRTIIVDAADVEKALDSGASLDSLQGTPTEIHKIQKTVDKRASKKKQLDTPIALPQDAATKLTNAKSSIPDSFEKESSVTPSPEGVGISKSPSPIAPSEFSQWATDPMEKMLQQKILDPEIPESARQAASIRLSDLSTDSANKVKEFMGLPRTPEEFQVPEPEGIGLLEKLQSATSSKGTLHIHSVKGKVGVDDSEAEIILQQGLREGLIVPDKVMRKGGEDLQFYRLAPKKITLENIPNYDKIKAGSGGFYNVETKETYESLEEALGASPLYQAEDPSVDELLGRLKARIKEQHPEIKFQRNPGPPHERDLQGKFLPKGETSLESALKASLDKLGVKYQGGYDAEDWSGVTKGDFIEAWMGEFPEGNPGEAAQYFDNKIRTWEIGSKPRELYNTGYAPSILNGAEAATFPNPGGKSGVVFGSRQTTRSTVFHEGTHALVHSSGVAPHLSKIFSDDFAAKLFDGAFSGDSGAFYRTHAPDSIPEEVFTWMSEAFRMNDRPMIRAFVEADGSEAELSSWYNNRVGEVLDSLAAQPDSLFKRRLDMRLKDLQRRSGASLEEMANEASVQGAEVDYHNGSFSVRDTNGVEKFFESKESLANHLRDEYSAPMTSPEFLDLHGLPEDTVLYASRRPPGNRAPTTTTPAPPELLPGKDIPAGMFTWSYYFRPFYGWVDDVAEKFHWPELSASMRAIESAEVGMRQEMREYETALKETIAKIPHARQSLLLKLMEAEPAKKFQTAEALGITPEEIRLYEEFNERFNNPLEGRLGVSIEHFVRKYHGPGTRDLETISAQGQFNRAISSEFAFLGKSYRTGDLDPRDQNLLAVSYEYLRAGMRKQHLQDPTRAAARLVNLTGEDKKYVAGNLQPLLARHINYLRGAPDQGARMVHEASRSVVNLLNKGIEKANKSLPDSWQLGRFDAPDKALEKWVTWQYAGGLAFRAMVPMRDVMQYFLTTYPMLGGKYSARGIQRVWESKADDNILETARKYGAMLEDRDVLRYEAGSAELAEAKGGRFDKVVEKAMSFLQISNNINRLAAFHGHAERIIDAFASEASLTSREAFAEKAGLNYLSKNLRDKFLDELMVLPKEKQADYAYRAAKQLVDVSQWGYSRGAAPGIYKSALGKLFGQYGTWPLNYIEYARKITGLGDAPLSGREKRRTLTRLALAHTAILRAGDDLGVDTGQWVFSSPMAYSGGPIYNALINVPQTFDFETQKGSDARRAVVRPLWPMSVPGGLFFDNTYKAIRDDNPDLWKIILGFHPMERGEYGTGYHALTSEEE